MTDFREELTKEMEDEFLRECEFEIKPKKFRHKQTGEVVEQVNILDIGDYEEL